MKRKFVPMVMISVLALSACGGDKEDSSDHGGVNDGEASNAYGAVDHGVDENKIGFSLSGDTIEEAANIPAAAKEQVLNAFEVYIDAFNKKDIDRYMETLSEHTESFDKKEERAYLTEKFEEIDFERTASDVTIVKYSDTEAQVFTNLQTTMKQLSSGEVTEANGRQVTLFAKEDEVWKVASVHYIGND